MLNYKYLLFDADGTLYDYHKSQDTALENLFNYYNIPYTENNISKYAVSNSLCWKEFEMGKIKMPELKIKRFKNFFSEMNLDYCANEANNVYCGYFASTGYMIDGAMEVLEALFGKFSLNLITNGISIIQRGRLKNSNTLHFYDNLLISEEMEVQKPNPLYFEKTLETIGAKKEECLIIGDSISADIKGGYGYGIDTMYLNLIDDDECEIATYNAKSFKELLDIILNH